MTRLIKLIRVGVTTYELWPSPGGWTVKAAHGGRNGEQYVGLSVGAGQPPALWPRGPMQTIQKAVNQDRG